MKKILVIILFLIAFKAQSQTPQAPIVFTDTSQMKAYTGSYFLAMVREVGFFYRTQGAFTPDGVNIFSSTFTGYFWIRQTGTPVTGGILVISTVDSLQFQTVSINTVVVVSDTARGGYFVSQSDAGHFVDEGIVFNSATSGIVFVRQVNPSLPVQLKWYDVSYDGVSKQLENTLALRYVLNTYPYVELGASGAILFDSVLITQNGLTINSSGAWLKMGEPDTAQAAAIHISANNVTIKTLYVDGNYTNRAGIWVDSVSDQTTVENYNVININAIQTDKIGQYPCAGVIECGSNSKYYSINARNIVNQGRSNHATPQIIQVYGNSVKCYIRNIYGDSIMTGAVIHPGSDIIIDNIECRNASDNGVYYLADANRPYHLNSDPNIYGDGSLILGTLKYTGHDATIVCEGRNAQIGTILVKGYAKNALAVDDGKFPNVNKNISVDYVSMVTADDTGRTGRVVFIRAGNDTSGTVSIGHLNFDVRNASSIFQAIDSTHGILQKLWIGAIDGIFHYDSSRTQSTDRNHIFDISAFREFYVGTTTIKIIDDNLTLTSDDRFHFVPPDTLFRQSYLTGGFNVDIYDSSNVASAAKFRGDGASVQMIHGSDLYYHSNNDSTVEFCGGIENGWVRNTINEVPTKGYWPIGTVLTLLDGTGIINCTDSTVDGGVWARDGYPTSAILASDFTTSSNVLATIPDFSLPVEANQKYKVDILLKVGAISTAGLKIKLTVGSGLTYLGDLITMDTVDVSVLNGRYMDAITTTVIDLNQFNGIGYVKYSGLLQTDNNAGTLQVQLADMNNGEAVDVFTHSYMILTKTQSASP